MKRIVVFTGAGVSAESGIATFRDTETGYWYNYKVDEVATATGWKKDREKVLEFHNMLRAKLPDVEPNDAHKALTELDEHFDVTVITQNVDDLHERAGQKKILHLHGELTKARSSYYDGQTHLLEGHIKLYDIGHGEINIGDKCEEHGSQLRPHTVLFEEYPFNVAESYEALAMADYLLVIGTSLQIFYTIDMLKSVNQMAKSYFIDPNPVNYLDDLALTKVEKTAVEGVREVIDEIYSREGLVVSK